MLWMLWARLGFVVGLLWAKCLIFKEVVNVVSVVSNIHVLEKKEKVGSRHRKEAERVGRNERETAEI